MDKYEYRVSLNEINSLVQERRFDEAAQIADTIDWRKVKSADTLCRISDIYKICKDYERARDILDIANTRNPHVPNIVYSLCELTIFLYGQTGSQADLAKALGLKQEYESECPDDPKRLILEYKFYKVSPVTIEEKIATLEQLRDEDPTARWEYELATLYHQNGQDELALNACRDIRRAYSGKFADKAAALAEEISPSSAPAAPVAAPAAEAPAEEAAPVEQAAYEAPTEEAAPVEEAVDEQPAEQPVYEAPAAAEAPVYEASAAEAPEQSYAPVHIADEAPAESEAQYDARAAYHDSVEAGQPAEEPAENGSESLSVGQVYDEWERIRRDIRKRNDEQRAQRIMQDTGPLLQDFDETARHGLIETIEKEAARQRRQARSGASRILGDDGYDQYGGRGGRNDYRDDARYDDRRYEPLPEQDHDYPEDDASYPEDNYEGDSYQDDRYEDDRYQDEAPVEEAPMQREAIHTETVHEEEHAPHTATRGSAFNAAVAAAAGAAAGAAASEADDIATRRWDSDEIRAAMERQKAAAEEQARKEAEEKACREAEEAARVEAERKAAERAQIEAEVRAQIAAEQKAAEEERARKEAEEQARREAEAKAAAEKAAAEEAARREAEARAAAEEQARKEAEAKAAAEKQQMYAEIEAKIRAEYESRLAEQAAAAAAVAAQAPAVEPAADEVIEEDVEQLADNTDDGINQISPAEEPDVPAEAPVQEPAEEDDLAEAIEQQTADSTEYDHVEPMDVDAHEGDHADEVAERYEPATSGNPIAPVLAGQETENLPASAASNIASANDKAPSPEELRLFGPFYRMKENRDQVTAALDKISLASYTGNIVITGNAVTARRVAQGLLELTREADSNFTGKIAKATGTALNNLTDDKFHAILSKIENGALIIEHASTMDDAAVQRLYNELEGREHGVIVILMDARKPVDAFLAAHPTQLGSFTARVDIRPLNDKALVEYGKDYANSKDYALDEMAELALASRVSSMQSASHRVTLKEVRDIIDEAISYGSRKTPQALMERLSGKRYDSEDRVILHEKDFQHV